jgi:DNA-binding SARP family transcriptional activator
VNDLSAQSGAGADRPSRRGTRWEETVDVFDQIPYGLVTVNRSGAVLAVNTAGRKLLLDRKSGPSRELLTCCDLICSRLAEPRSDAPPCLTEEALQAEGPLDEVQIDLPPGAPSQLAWVTASPLGGDAGAIFHLRAHDSEAMRSLRPPAAATRLRVFAFGRTRVESSTAGSIGGAWIDQRPGQLLKYLICAQGRVVAAEEIAQALWPETDARALSSVRYFVHTLRTRLEPMRGSGTPSSFIESRRGGYSLNTQRVWIDASEFEQLVASGLAALAAGERETALHRLEPATNLYRGDFLADEPYADWALAERDRYQELAGRALRALTELRLAADDLEGAVRHARRLADTEPYDNDAQRRHIELSLRRGRRTDAIRRYKLFEQRLQRNFGVEPDFTLAELLAADDSLDRPSP